MLREAIFMIHDSSMVQSTGIPSVGTIQSATAATLDYTVASGDISSFAQRGVAGDP